MRNKLLFILLIACVAFVGCQAKEAEARSIVIEDDSYNVTGVKIDAPNLITIGKGWTLGAEGGKDVVKNIFYDDNAFLEADRGYFAYVKVTYSGCLLNCKEE